MKGFKLIAIRPLKDCNRRFLKNLKTGEIYKLYQDFRFLNNENSTVRENEEVIKIKYKTTLPEDLYNVKSRSGKEINVNICAIVGKNGSGKSAISEFLLYNLFFISNQLNFIDKTEFIETNSQNNAEITESESYDKDVKEILNGLKSEIYFSMDQTLFKISISNAKIKITEAVFSNGYFIFSEKSRQILQKTDLPAFFYSMVINYSFYAFNTYQIGNWIKAFFHKNDGYQMPIVISPFREKGNLDINTETYLTSTRLLANVLSISSYKNINPKSSINKIELYFDAKKDYRFLSDGTERFTEEFIKTFREKIILPLFNLTFKNLATYPTSENEIIKYAEIYLIHKLITIPTKYKVFSAFDKKIRKKDSQDNCKITDSFAAKYVNELFEDKSHITLKVRQTLNFLRENIYGITDLSFKSNFKLNSVVKQINKNITREWYTETIDYLPPPFLVSRIQFNDGSYFQQLSSGEKQKIHSLNSIIYHLKNIDSVHKNKIKNKERGIIEYKSINLIFDEIELYYHPDFQRNLISDLLAFIRRANYKHIENINIVFLTHSPFVLSDIPAQNTLLLNVDSKSGVSLQVGSKKQTFAANINDLLADNFFLKDTLIGKFSDKKITTLIGKIKDQKFEQSDNKLLNIIGDSFLKSNITQYVKSNDSN